MKNSHDAGRSRSHYRRLWGNRRRRLMKEQLETRRVLASDWQNELYPQDVNDDANVTPLDALLVINSINLLPTTPVDFTQPVGTNPYLDTSGDARLSPIDALLVINEINEGTTFFDLGLKLQNDSGSSSTDRITNDLSVAGKFSVPTSGLSSLRARIDRGDVVDVVFDTQGNFVAAESAFEEVFDGTHDVTFAARDGAGKRSLKRISLTLDTVAPATAGPSILSADDTGYRTDDGITRLTNPRISFETELGASVELRLDGSSLFVGSFVSLLTLPTSNLTEGSHTLTVRATDVAGNVLNETSQIVVDTTSPPAPVLDLAATSDSAPVGDRTTRFSRATLRGVTESNSFVTIDDASITARSTGDGGFQLAGVPLIIGSNVVKLTISDPAGNQTTAQGTITRVAETGDASSVVQWNQALLNAIQRDASIPPIATRNMAMVNLAVYDVINAIEKTPSFTVRMIAPSIVSMDAAISSAATHVLTYVYPAQAATFDATYSAILASIADGAGKTNGINFGKQVAEAIIAFRAKDGWDKFVDYVPDGSISKWQPTAPMFDVAQSPQWADLQSFGGIDLDSLVPDGPPDLQSQEYADAYNEVKSLGALNSTTRTAEQTQIARFWSDGAGTYTPPGHWSLIATQLATAQDLSAGESARLFAMLSTALSDASIVAWKAKYKYEAWRPIDAIQKAANDSNAATSADASWAPFLITPPHPEYVSGHSTYSAAAARILASYFGDNTAFSTTSLGLANVTRSFSSFTQAVAEAGRSRIYGGIHFEFSNQDGQLAGRSVADAVLARFNQADDLDAPVVVFDGQSDAVYKTNPVITGKVLDNLSGVASVVIQLDDGQAIPLTLDATNGFAFQPAFTLTGTDNGLHTILVTATDNVGLTSEAFRFTFVLDTQAPTIDITAPAASANLSLGDQLVGTVSGTGSAIVSLTYQWDAGPLVTVAYSPTTGSFSQVLDLSKLSLGNHTLRVVAKDAAGLETVQTRSVQLVQAIPLQITRHTPLAGSSDIGSTFRPQVYFTRPTDKTTLTPASFYATGPDGTKLPATIVPSQDGTFAWLFFTSPMPGSSSITVTLDGNQIKGLDGQIMDANNDGTPGGVYTYSFSTLSLASLPNTSIKGKVVDPGVDLKMMTRDDILAGPDGALHTADDVFLNPIAGAKVYILGRESQAVFTDASGNFVLTSVPAGNVKLAIDGRTATNAPAGIFWPEMVMDLELDVGYENTVMGSMGTREEKAANEDRTDVYLPRVQNSILTPISTASPTRVTVDAASSPNLTEEQRQWLILEATPGSVIGESGQTLTNASIGISTVPPELVRDMLPPGLMQHTFDITIQAPSAMAFSPPLRLTFPNIYSAAPGTKLNIISFDHTTGQLVIDGTASVNENGLSVTSDSDSGITRPGWHGLTPPGVQSEPPCPPTSGKRDVPPIFNSNGLNNYYFFYNEGQIKLHFANDAKKITPSADSCAGENLLATPLRIDISYGPESKQFIEGLGAASGMSYSLQPGESTTLTLWIKDNAPLINAVSNMLYGARIHVDAYWLDSKGAKHTLSNGTNGNLYVYRFFDISDNKHSDSFVDFPRTLSDLGAAISQRSDLRYLGDPLARPKLNLEGPNKSSFSIDEGGQAIFFHPGSSGRHFAQVQILSPDNQFIGRLGLSGTGIDAQVVTLSTADLRSAILRLFITSAPEPQIDRLTDLLPNPITDVDSFDQAVSKLAEEIRFRMREVLAEYGLTGGLQVVDSNSREGIRLQFFGNSADSPEPEAVGLSFYVDFMSDYFLRHFDPTHESSFISDAQRKYIFASLFNRNVTDLYPSSSLLNANTYAAFFNLYAMARQVGYQTVRGHQPAPEGPAAFRRAFVNRMAISAVHEVGHLIGAIHQRTDAYTYFTEYLMGLGTLVNFHIPKLGPEFEAVFRFAVGLPVSDEQFHDSLRYYQNQVKNEVRKGYSFNSEGFDADGERFRLDPPGSVPETVVNNEPQIALLDGPSDNFNGASSIQSIEFKSAVGSNVIKTFFLFNTGSAPLSITNLELLNSTDEFSVTTIGPNTLAGFNPSDPDQSKSRMQLNISYQPKNSTIVENALIIKSNSSIRNPMVIPLLGTAFSQHGELSILEYSTNFGGVFIGDVSSKNDTVALSNTGAETLRITALQLNGSSDEFALTDLPISFPAAPIIIEPGESRDLSVLFRPAKPGIRSGILEVTTDANGPQTSRVSFTGTGLAPSSSLLRYGYDYVVVENLTQPNSPVMRQKSSGTGDWRFVLSPLTEYRYGLFDPESGLVAHSFFSTSQSAMNVRVPTPVFMPSISRDSDLDGLPDDIEYVIGTSPELVDSNGDGISDSASLEQGLDPLSNRPARTGILANIRLQGEAKQIVVQGDITNVEKQTAFIATGSYGLAIVDVSQFNKPTLLGQIDLPGNSVDVAVDAFFGVAVVAADSGGIHFVDVATQSRPRLLKTVIENARAVKILDGYAYAAVGTQLLRFDVLTGEKVDSLTLGGTMTGLALDGTNLFSMGPDKVLRAIEIKNGRIVARGTLTMPVGGGKLSVGGGVAYVPVGSGLTSGFATASVRDTANLTLLSGVDGNNIASEMIVANGSGLAVSVGALGAANTVTVLNVNDPTVTNSFVTSFSIPSAPQSVVIAGGIAFVADDRSGLYVVNYQPFDSKKQTPTASISVDAGSLDILPQEPGIQVLEGTAIPISITTTDDVQVRSIDLLVNGQVTKRTLSFPFNLSAIAPSLPSGGPDGQFIVQARATDTGGNSTLSNPITIDIRPDTVAPVIDRFEVTSKDIDPSKAGIQVLEGTDVRARFVTSDLGGLSSVELLLNGVSTQSQPRRDGFFVVSAPQLAVNESSRDVAVQLRATDRAGNITTSQPQSFTVVVDAFAPKIVSMNLREGDTKPAGGFWLNVEFDEAMAPTTLTESNFLLNGPDGAMVFAQSIKLIGSNSVSVRYQLEKTGAYTLSIDATKITDRSGNPLDTSPRVISFNSRFASIPLFPNERLSVGAGPRALTTGDFNGDGRLDLITANYRSNDVSVRLDNGDGTFAGQKKFGVGSFPMSVTTGDVNGDGRLDLITANDTNNVNGDVSILLGNGDGTFAAQSKFVVGNAPYSVTTGDFNGDGRLDLVTANSGNNDLSVLLGNGDGTFASQTRFPVGFRPNFVTTGDVNGDGKLDVIAANEGSSDVSILLGNSDGTFAAQTKIAVGNWPISVATGDVNGDGRLDVVTSNRLGNDVSILLGKGDGTFAVQTKFGVGSSPISVTMGDLNGDGRLDIITANTSGGSDVSVLLGNGDGTFAIQKRYSVGISPYSVITRDVNGDGRLDVITVNDTNSLVGDISILLGNGDGTLAVQTKSVVGSSPNSVTRGDVNGDGKLDLITANSGGGDVSILLGNGDGTFAGQTKFGAGSSPYSVTTADINRDGRLDLITANNGGGDVSILLGNGDGTFAGQTKFSVGSRPYSVATHDVNGDGRLDVITANSGGADVSILLGNGDGTFVGQMKFSVGSSPFSVTTADINEDSKLDIITANFGSNDVSILLGNGDGTFAVQTKFGTGTGPFSVTTADVNGDSRLDVITANRETNDVSILLSNGDGTFAGQTKYGAGSNPYSVTTGDVNGDGRLDVITANNGSNDVSILLGKGDGTFKGQQKFGAGAFPVSVTMGDLNADGRLDLITANNLNDVSILINQGGTAGNSLLAARSSPTDREQSPPLLKSQTLFLMPFAIQWWTTQGVSAERFSHLELRVGNLINNQLGYAAGNTIWLDDDAAGWGWFIDATPMSNEEFEKQGTQWIATFGTSSLHMDLLTVLIHELGHILGLDDEFEDDDRVMSYTLDVGIRRLPSA